MGGKGSPLLGILFSLPRKAAIQTPFPKPRSQGAQWVAPSKHPSPRKGDPSASPRLGGG